jgi:hypothetical protein
VRRQAALGLAILLAVLAAGVSAELWVSHMNAWVVGIGNFLPPLLFWVLVRFDRRILNLANRGTKRVRSLAGRLTRFSVSGLTDLAALLAGSSRPALRDEWRAHLAGESGHDPVTWRKVRQALGFVASAIQYRIADAADLAWRPADAVLRSRALSNLFVCGPVIVVLVAIVRHDGRYGLVADDQDPVALGTFLYGAIRTGRWWRGVKPPQPKARRARE